MKYFYNISNWDIPKNYLCPPIPGRADYVHQAADLLGAMNGGQIPLGGKIRMLDIGVGANCVYPLIANSEYKWHIVGTDIDQVALNSASKIVESNKLETQIKLRLQPVMKNIFEGIILKEDFFDITISNPPFHSSLEEAQGSNQRKTKNLGRPAAGLNFGGVANELWCTGGEVAFAKQMIKESITYKYNCFWYSTLISKYTSLPEIYDALKMANVQDFKTIDMAQGQKKSRVIAWTFHNPHQIKTWREKNFI